MFITAFITRSILKENNTPKVRIERLENEACHFAAQIGKMRRETQGTLRLKSIEDAKNPIAEYPLSQQIEKRHKMINALLDYYFDEENEEDKEYIEEHRYK